MANSRMSILLTSKLTVQIQQFCKLCNQQINTIHFWANGYAHCKSFIQVKANNIAKQWIMKLNQQWSFKVNKMAGKLTILFNIFSTLHSWRTEQSTLLILVTRVWKFADWHALSPGCNQVVIIIRRSVSKLRTNYFHLKNCSPNNFCLSKIIHHYMGVLVDRFHWIRKLLIYSTDCYKFKAARSVTHSTFKVIRPKFKATEEVDI